MIQLVGELLETYYLVSMMLSVDVGCSRVSALYLHPHTNRKVECCCRRWVDRLPSSACACSSLIRGGESIREEWRLGSVQPADSSTRHRDIHSHCRHFDSFATLHSTSNEEVNRSNERELGQMRRDVHCSTRAPSSCPPVPAIDVQSRAKEE